MASSVNHSATAATASVSPNKKKPLEILFSAFRLDEIMKVAKDALRDHDFGRLENALACWSKRTVDIDAAAEYHQPLIELLSDMLNGIDRAFPTPTQECRSLLGHIESIAERAGITKVLNLYSKTRAAATQTQEVSDRKAQLELQIEKNVAKYKS
jgi:hypothetical protein